MPILPYRVAREALAPDGEPLTVYYVHDRPVAIRYASAFTIYENPFPAADPRHSLTAELLALLAVERPRWCRPMPWHPTIVEDLRARHTAGAPARARNQEASRAILQAQAERRRKRTGRSGAQSIGEPAGNRAGDTAP